MSHFSKINTNLSDSKILTKTLKQLGFIYTLNNYSTNDNQDPNIVSDISVFKVASKQEPIFHFTWDNNQYNLVADLTLWNLDVSANCLLEKLAQQYAFNLILDESLSIGFDKQTSVKMLDGSLKLVVEKWKF